MRAKWPCASIAWEGRASPKGFILQERIMETSTPFKWRHFQAEIFLLCVRWYLRYPQSNRDLKEMMLERGLHVDHTTIYRCAHHYAPELEKRGPTHLKATNDS